MFYGNGPWTIISLILAVIGGIAAYILFLPAKNEGKYTGFVKWLYEFLSFKFLTIEVILKVAYMVLAIWLTLSAIGYLGYGLSGVLLFFGTIIFGNLGLRIAFEGCLLLIMLYKNTKEINSKIK